MRPSAAESGRVPVALQNNLSSFVLGLVLVPCWPYTLVLLTQVIPSLTRANHRDALLPTRRCARARHSCWPGRRCSQPATTSDHRVDQARPALEERRRQCQHRGLAGADGRPHTVRSVSSFLIVSQPGTDSTFLLVHPQQVQQGAQPSLAPAKPSNLLPPPQNRNNYRYHALGEGKNPESRMAREKRASAGTIQLTEQSMSGELAVLSIRKPGRETGLRPLRPGVSPERGAYLLRGGLRSDATELLTTWRTQSGLARSTLALPFVLRFLTLSSLSSF